MHHLKESWRMWAKETETSPRLLDCNIYWKWVSSITSSWSRWPRGSMLPCRSYRHPCNWNLQSPVQGKKKGGWHGSYWDTPRDVCSPRVCSSNPGMGKGEKREQYLEHRKTQPQIPTPMLNLSTPALEASMVRPSPHNEPMLTDSDS